MPGFSSTNNDPKDSAIDAFSAGEGVHATTTSPDVAAVAAYHIDKSLNGGGAAVYAKCDGAGSGVVALQTLDQGKGSGVWSEASGLGNAISAFQKNQASDGAGLYAEIQGSGNAVHAKLNNFNSTGAALFAEHIGNKTAGFFKGDVIVTGDVSLQGMDCAEEFIVAAETPTEPGTLMTIGADGVLEPSSRPYDRRVAGVVAGAGDCRPGIVLGKNQHGAEATRPIALVGRVWCRADASHGPIDIGDLLTSSPTPGHAMKVSDPQRAFGAVIGKALAPLAEGFGLVPILIALQ